MHNLDLILTLTGGLTAALLLGLLTQRLGLSSLVGYLLAGVLVGPHTPGFVADASMAEQFAEVGVILLMFGVGLQFHLDELLAVRRVAIPGAVGQSLVATALGAVVVHQLGWSWSAGVVFGMALAVASTVVLIRILVDHNALHTPAGHVAVGWLVVEDLFTVVALVLLPALFGPSSEEGSLGRALLLTGAKVALLIAFTAVVGVRVIPWLLDKVAATRSRELFTLAVLVIALGIAVGSAKIFGVSMALGAFLAGMVVGRSDYSLRAASDALPMRDAFAVLFFVSVGMLLNPGSMLDAPLLMAATLGVVLVAKPLVALVLMRVMGHPLKTALSVSFALAQIGEFSFILASVGRELGILGEQASQALVATALVSIVVNPMLYRSAPAIERWVMARPRLRALLAPAGAEAPASPQGEATPSHRAVVVGYGPTGRTLTRLLRENGVGVVVIELNMETVRALRAEQIPAIYGEASHAETLVGAGVGAASWLILTWSGTAGSSEIIRKAREINPEIHILARTQYLRERAELSQAGADTVFSAEGEVALAFTEAVLGRLGATAEQIDRERERAHRELFGGDEPSAARSPAS